MTSSALFLLMAAVSTSSLDCPTEWDGFDDSCYKVMTSFLYSQRLSWENARAVCLGYGGDLVSIRDKKEEEFINSLSSDFRNDLLWIGLNDRVNEGQFVWSDGTYFNSSVYSNWRTGDPSHTGNEDCVGLRNNLWNDQPCSYVRFYICERPKGKSACPDGWFLNGLSCYKASEQAKPWSNAKENCHAYGGYLMKIDDASEQQFLEVYLLATGINQVAKYVWIGLNDIKDEGTFTWEVDESNVEFSKWGSEQPDNDNNQDCVTVGAKQMFSLWEDHQCDTSHLYMCEKPASGISCYRCLSNMSFADCETKQEIVNCTFPRNYCFKQKNSTIDKNDQESVFCKGCISADQCRQREKSSMECCGDTLCNKDISCYQCSSNTSFADCAKNQTKVDCTLPKNRCVKATYTSEGDNGTVTYNKGCSTTDQCSETAEKSFVECCSHDMCNKESGLACYECSSTVSHEECEERRQQVACQSSMADRCYYASMQQTSQDGSSVTKRFKHGCINNKDCSNTAKIFAQCTSSSEQCEVRCCNENLCNEVIKEDKATPEVLTEESTVFDIPIAYILLGVACSLLLLCSAVAFWSHKKSNRKRLDRSDRRRREIIPLDKWEILPEQIEYKEELGRGAFGVVYKAILKKRQGIEVFDSREVVEPAKESNQMVAVKTLQDDPSEAQEDEFLFEISMMKVLGAHRNIVSLVGCCTLQDHKFLVIEYIPFGDLLHWLRRKRRSITRNEATDGLTTDECCDDKQGHSKPCQEAEVVLRTTKEEDAPTDQTSAKKDSALSYDKEDFALDLTSSSDNIAEEEDKIILNKETGIELTEIPLTTQRKASKHLLSDEDLYDGHEEDGIFTTQQLFSFAWQIARGMNHLAEKDFVHRDLAARNILVGHDNRVKVSDFGLMRQIYEDVYTTKKTKKLPVKWMAPESIEYSAFTIKSDVWSYGVLLWEMATMGGAPYPTMTNIEICGALKNGYRMERPAMCCDEVYELMNECWREDPDTRPSFSELIGRVETVMTRNVPYCDFSKHDESSPYYSAVDASSETSF